MTAIYFLILFVALIPLGYVIDVLVECIRLRRTA